MEVQYRKSFLKDLNRIHNHSDYNRVVNIAFNILCEVEKLRDVPNLKPIKGYPGRYRIRSGNYRIGVRLHEQTVEVMRVLHRREFYRYFP